MSLGFIILRHVNSLETNRLWIECYDSIRKFYPLHKILIIDDNSKYNFVDKSKVLFNTLLIQSEFPGRGELLPYYYYLQHKLFDRAVILHDSVFINQFIDFDKENNFLWEFEHDWDNYYNEDLLINHLHNKDIIKTFHKNKHLWKGCFGVMSVLSHDFLCEMNILFNFTNLINVITDRDKRMSWERVFAVLFTLCNSKNNKQTSSIFKNIHNYCDWGGTYNQYKSKPIENKPIIKVWSGR